MNEALRVWTDQAAAIPGVMALGVRAANQSVVAKSFHDDFPLRMVEKLALEVLDTVRALQMNRVSADRLRWTFEKAWLFYAGRTDGSFVILVVTNHTAISPEVDRFLVQFQAG